MRKQAKIYTVLTLLVVGMLILYLSYHTYGNWDFALKLRGKKVLAFLFVGIAVSFSTISFQTVAQSHFLTPSILGLDSLYVLVQTALYFFLGTAFVASRFTKNMLFSLNVLCMVAMSLVLFLFIFRQTNQNLYLLLMVGMILGTFFRSFSTFLQVMMDPNEYDKLQGSLFASFNHVDTGVLQGSSVTLVLVLLYLWFLSPQLDVLHLGKDHATALGISVAALQWQTLICVSVLVALSTALVGPVTFLGFIIANVTYTLMGTYHHRSLFIGGSLIGIILLLCGQFLIEQVFQMNATQSMIIEFIGGCYFVGMLFSKGKEG